MIVLSISEEIRSGPGLFPNFNIRRIVEAADDVDVFEDGGISTENEVDGVLRLHIRRDPCPLPRRSLGKSAVHQVELALGTEVGEKLATVIPQTSSIFPDVFFSSLACPYLGVEVAQYQLADPRAKPRKPNSTKRHRGLQSFGN